MGTEQTGSCPRCGSPIYSESPWWGIIPPPAIKSCSCFPNQNITTSDGTGAQIIKHPPSTSTSDDVKQVAEERYKNKLAEAMG